MSCAYGPDTGKYCTVGTSCVCLSGWTVIEYIIFCHVIWWISYWFLILASRQSEEWCCRFLTFIHGCVVSYLALNDILMNKEELDFQNTPLTEEQKNYLSFTLSYFVFDFFWIHFFGNEAWVIYFHHLSSILIIIEIMFNDFGGIGISYGIAGLEFTNPYLQLRWFLRTYGYLNTPIHTGLEIWLFFLFFTIRLVGGTFLLYYILKNAETDVLMKLSLLSIYMVSVILAWQILAYVRKKYFNNRRRSIPFMMSRVSISPYFQRRTLDNVNHVGFSHRNIYIPPERRPEPLPPPSPSPSSPPPSSSSGEESDQTEGRN